MKNTTGKTPARKVAEGAGTAICIIWLGGAAFGITAGLWKALTYREPLPGQIALDRITEGTKVLKAQQKAANDKTYSDCVSENGAPYCAYMVPFGD